MLLSLSRISHKRRLHLGLRLFVARRRKQRPLTLSLPKGAFAAINLRVTVFREIGIASGDRQLPHGCGRATPPVDVRSGGYQGLIYIIGKVVVSSRD